MATETTAVYKVTRYRDGEVLGTIRIGRDGYAKYERLAQWPEGIVRAGSVLSSRHLQDMGASPDETIWLD